MYKMIGKVISGVVLLLLVVVAVGGAAAASSIGGSDMNVSAALGSAVASAALVFLLNSFGLWFGRKSFGVIGMLISIGVLIYGVYVLVSKKALGTTDPTMTTIIGATSTSVGSVSLLTSLGVITHV